ncbi:hypothetical protein CEXT_460151 [Caerostris extrusa]|uniref:Uncharacterized protein n=1 Tax=Caerostris extrusa TaxID=172846 RepID=A0AAV4WFJ0_CAEEX|nr:hypothetical protein CEXT_460151 [Caerostris extrusa]
MSMIVNNFNSLTSGQVLNCTASKQESSAKSLLVRSIIAFNKHLSPFQNPSSVASLLTNAAEDPCEERVAVMDVSFLQNGNSFRVCSGRDKRGRSPDEEGGLFTRDGGRCAAETPCDERVAVMDVFIFPERQQFPRLFRGEISGGGLQTWKGGCLRGWGGGMSGRN